MHAVQFRAAPRLNHVVHANLGRGAFAARASRGALTRSAAADTNWSSARRRQPVAGKALSRSLAPPAHLSMCRQTLDFSSARSFGAGVFTHRIRPPPEPRERPQERHAHPGVRTVRRPAPPLACSAPRWRSVEAVEAGDDHASPCSSQAPCRRRGPRCHVGRRPPVRVEGAARGPEPATAEGRGRRLVVGVGAVRAHAGANLRARSTRLRDSSYGAARSSPCSVGPWQP